MLGPFWYLYKDTNKLFKLNASKLHLSNWQTQARGLCQKANTHLYTVNCVDKIVAVIVISICFWHNATFAFSMITYQLLTPVGGAYGKKMTI